MNNFHKWFSRTFPLPPTVERGPVGRELLSGCRASWEAALEWVLKNRLPYYDSEDKKVVATDSDIIYKELQE